MQVALSVHIQFHKKKLPYDIKKMFIADLTWRTQNTNVIYRYKTLLPFQTYISS